MLRIYAVYMYMSVPRDDSRYRGAHWSKAPVGRVGCIYTPVTVDV